MIIIMNYAIDELKLIIIIISFEDEAFMIKINSIFLYSIRITNNILT